MDKQTLCQYSPVWAKAGARLFVQPSVCLLCLLETTQNILNESRVLC